MSNGDLVIVGGAEVLERKTILSRFVELSGGPEGRFLVLASATGSPLEGFERQRRWLGEAGVAPERVELLRVSGKVDGWERGAWDGAELDRLERADGLWLLGGDQNLTIALLQDEAGGDSPLLAAIRRRAARSHAEGGLVVGGTSAGAAVLSDPMLCAGTSFGALALPRAKGPGEAEMSPALLVGRGFGLFPEGVVDQHFDARARLARLAEAALVEDGARRPAFGIAEATALVYEGGPRRISVTRAGTVCVLDSRGAKRSLVPTKAGPRLRIEDLLFHCLTEGDSYFPGEERVDFGLKEELPPSGAAFASERPEASGVLSPYSRLADFAARMLLDNAPGLLFLDPRSGRRYARSLLVEETGLPEGGSACLGWEIRLGRHLPGREGPGRKEGRLYYDGRYSFENVYVDILPLEIDINRPE